VEPSGKPKAPIGVGQTLNYAEREYIWYVKRMSLLGGSSLGLPRSGLRWKTAFSSERFLVACKTTNLHKVFLEAIEEF
jgi:hypothetical protein